MTSKQRFGTIRRMMRSMEKWWVLWKLQQTTRKHTTEQDYKLVVSGGVAFDPREGFIDWVSRCSLNRWAYRFKLWKIFDDTKREQIYNNLLKTRIDLYNSLINSCSGNGYVASVNNNHGDICIRVTPSGDDYISSYWWERTIGSAIGTAIIIGLILWFVESRFENLIKKPQFDKPYQIQIIPYEQQNGTIIRPR